MITVKTLFKSRLDEAFGYVKNGRLIAEENITEPHEGHVHWASLEGESRVQSEIGKDVQRILDTVNNLSKEKLDTIFGYVKNARQMITRGIFEAQGGHESWAHNESADRVIHEIEKDSNTVIENEEYRNFNISEVLPINAEKTDDLGNSRKMVTSIKVSNTGRIDAVTEISTHEALRGFHGSVVVLLIDEEGNYIFKSNPHTYGVDGTGTGINTPSKRKVPWDENFPQDIIDKIRGYEIIHFLDPESTLEATLGAFNRILDQLVDASNKIKKIHDTWASEAL
ncbi:hypothetical protein AR454_28010 [Bacillus mycoides]|uniref:hypothetical protein n=1 Tax=Bacillus mycoides TaxID=1405 RepID=UPI001E46F84A|nr:hypothetical protein [Bacillus mycoides]MCD4646215.1 hypothetical protein [Bacillus mycoides]